MGHLFKGRAFDLVEHQGEHNGQRKAEKDFQRTDHHRVLQDIPEAGGIDKRLKILPSHKTAAEHPLQGIVVQKSNGNAVKGKDVKQNKPDSPWNQHQIKDPIFFRRFLADKTSNSPVFSLASILAWRLKTAQSTLPPKKSYFFAVYVDYMDAAFKKQSRFLCSNSQFYNPIDFHP